MKLWSPMGRDLVPSVMAGLAGGVILGVVEILILVGIDRFTGLSSIDLLGILLACSALGLLGGLGLGLLWARRAGGRGARPAELAHSSPAPAIPGALARVSRSLTQGMGAGLVAGAVVGLVEIAGLTIVDGSWQALSGLLYAIAAYGLLGLLGGLALGLLWSFWQIYRDRRGSGIGQTGQAAWVTCTTLVVSVGSFLVVHNRVRRNVLEIPLRHLNLAESLLVDNALLFLVITLALGLWFSLRRLARRGWPARFRWNVGAYLILLLVAVSVSNAPGLVSNPVPPDEPGSTALAPGLHDKPNIIFIVAETLRADRLGCYGNTRGLTPHLDALARDGVLYRHMSVQAPWTRPSVATMLTSLYPTSHQATGQLLALPDEVVTLPEILSDIGYHTAGFTTNIQTSRRFNFHQGYSQYTFLMADPPSFTFGTPIAERFAVAAFLRRLREAVSPTRPCNEEYQNAAAVNQHALAWIEANRDTRFFLFLHYFDPHDPYFAHPYDGTNVSKRITPNPAATQAPYLRQLYDGEVTYLDEYLGRLFDQLKTWGLYDDMLIVFTSDHGEEFYEHQGWWHSETLYEELLAVPLIVKYPGQAHAGTIDHELARGLDLSPTLLDVLGVPIPEAMQGVSLRPGAAVARAEFVFAEVGRNKVYAIRTPDHKLIVAEGQNPRNLSPEELFDLRTDPGEQQNLVTRDPDTVRRLRALLDQVIAYAKSHAVATQAGEVDADTRERLQQLGY